MTNKACDKAVEKRFEAFNTYQKWMEGCAATYLRQKYQSVGDQPAAFERWFYDAPKIILVPGELKQSSLAKGQAKRISNAAEVLGTHEVWEGFVNAANDMPALAKLCKRLGLQEKDISMLVALTTVAVAVGSQNQAKTCGAECPYSHALGCLIGGECTRPAGHAGKHKDGRGHKWN